jgi:hypothetical protein
MPTTIPVPQGLDRPSCIRLLYIGALIERRPPFLRLRLLIGIIGLKSERERRKLLLRGGGSPTIDPSRSDAGHDHSAQSSQDAFGMAEHAHREFAQPRHGLISDETIKAAHRTPLSTYDHAAYLLAGEFHQYASRSC